MFHPRRPGLVRPVAVDPAGRVGPTAEEARGPRWRRTSRGFYVPVGTDMEDVDQRIAASAPLLSHREAVTGWAALRWWGGGWFTGTAPDGSMLPVPLSVASHRAPQSGFTMSQETVRPWALSELDGLPVTTAAWAAAFAARHASTWWRSVEALDMAAYDDLVSLEELAPFETRLNSWTGVPQLRQALAHMDENSWSPQETRMRLVWTEVGGYDRPLCNRPVFDLGGDHLATPDLIDPVAGIVGEYDGTLHLVGERRRLDLEREARLRGVGIEVVTMVEGDIAAPDGFLRRLDDAFARARRRVGLDRAWTLQPPPWWTPTHTVARRRGLAEDQRRRLLGYRSSA